MEAIDRPHQVSSLRLVLDGERAQLGQIDAVDVTRLIDGAIRAVARAAEVIAGRQPGRVGRRGAAVEQATRFRFAGTFAGSVGVVLEGPRIDGPPAMGLELDDAELTELALTSTLDSLVGDELDAYVARGLAELAEDLDIGRRHSALQFIVEGSSTRARTGVLDASARGRLDRVAAEARLRTPSVVAGTLVEADFEKLTARLRTPDGRTVRVAFSVDQSDDVHDALRHQANFDGVVTYDTFTKEAVAIEMRAVRRTRQLGLNVDGGEFWSRPTIPDLAVSQGVDVADADALRDETLTEEDISRFLEALDS